MVEPPRKPEFRKRASEPDASEKRGSKKHFARPELMEYGSVVKLTQGGRAVVPTAGPFLT